MAGRRFAYLDIFPVVRSRDRDTVPKRSAIRIRRSFSKDEEREREGGLSQSISVASPSVYSNSSYIQPFSMDRHLSFLLFR